MTKTAENVAERFGITREQQDSFAVESQRKALAAIGAGYFKNEIVPVEVREKKKTFTFDTDEFPRPGTTMEVLAGLKSIVKPGGTVTAGNSCGLNDGAAAVDLDENGTIEMTVKRGSEKLKRTLTLQTYTDENGAEVRRYGFTYGGIVVATPLVRLQYSWYNTLDFVRLVRMSLMMLVSGSAGLDDLSGPVGIVSTITEVGKETEAEAGFGAALESILYFAAMIAVNLAVMNLLPLPALDGGHVLFLLVNGIAVALFKKEIPPKYLNVINGIGFALLMALMLFVTFHDIVKLL